MGWVIKIFIMQPSKITVKSTRYIITKLVPCYHASAMIISYQQAKANVSSVFIGPFEKSIIQSYLA